MRASLLITMGLAVLLTACSTQTDTNGETPLSATTNSGSPEETNRQAGSTAVFLTLENNIRDWWGGAGVPITWKVTEVDSYDWDGGSRPDNPPPQGLQGLVQQSLSGPVATRLEQNRPTSHVDPRFVLTPIADIEGKAIPLAPITVDRLTRDRGGWQLMNADQKCGFTRPSPRTVVTSWTEKTPKGLLAYDLVLDCIPEDRGGSKITIRNYQKQ